MKEDKEAHTDSHAGESGTASEGKDFNPSDLDEDAPAESSRPNEAVPIGRPISEAEYSRLKQRARDEDLPSAGGHAQEDPSHRERDG